MYSSRYRGSPVSRKPSPGFRAIRALLSLGLIVVASGTFVYGVTLLPPGPVDAYPVPDFKVRNWQNTRSGSVRHQPDQPTIDALTRQGYSGALDFDPSAGAISMDIRDRNGVHLDGVHVIARLSGPNQTGQSQFLLRQGSDFRYAAELGRLERGDWAVSVTASNPNEQNNPPFLFHIDKVITVN